MGKVFDITDKLSYEESSIIKVKNVELHVNDDAETMLKVMNKLGDKVTAKNVVEMYELLIPEKDRKELSALKLRFEDFQKVVKAAINVATGQDIDFDEPDEVE